MRSPIIVIAVLMFGSIPLAGCESQTEDDAYEETVGEAMEDAAEDAAPIEEQPAATPDETPANPDSEAPNPTEPASTTGDAGPTSSAGTGGWSPPDGLVLEDFPMSARPPPAPPPPAPVQHQPAGEDADDPPSSPAADPVVQCSRPRKMLRRSDCQRWEAYFASLETASVDVVAPADMWRGETKTIEVSLLLDEAAEEESESEGAEVIVEAVPVTPIMGARLRGDAFDVVPATTSTVTMDGADPEIVFIEVGIASRPTWKWEVTAKGDGDEQLVVELFVVPDRDGDAPTDESHFKDAEASIEIKVKTIDRINQWIDDHIPLLENLKQFVIALTALLVAIFTLWKVIRRRGGE